MKKILIVVDYQNDFVSPNGALPVPDAFSIQQNIQDRIDSNKYEAIIYTFDTHNQTDYNSSDEKNIFGFPIHCEYGTKGWNLFGIKPKNNTKFKDTISDMSDGFEMVSIKNEHFFTKDVFNIWEGNPIYPMWFENTFPSEEFEIDVVGVATNYCVSMNVMGMVERQYTINIIDNCVKGITNMPNGEIDESYEKNINVMKNRGVSFISNIPNKENTND